MQAIKKMVNRLQSADLPDDADLIGQCYGSDDFREGVAAYVAKRPAVWTGR
jgi:hypothetical protein